LACPTIGGFLPTRRRDETVFLALMRLRFPQFGGGVVRNTMYKDGVEAELASYAKQTL
jgi:hypothetical protein